MHIRFLDGFIYKKRNSKSILSMVHKRRTETKQISKGPDRGPSHSERLADTGGPNKEADIPTRNLCH